jgi:hypothetical protein
MPVVVWLRITGGDLVETAKDQVADVTADMGDQYRPGSIRDRTGQIDWADAGKRAGQVAAKGIGGLGSMVKVGGPMVIMMVAEWFLAGALELLGEESNKPAADALHALGDAMLDVIAKVLQPMIPLLLRAIKAIYPVLTAHLEILQYLAPLLVPVLQLTADVFVLVAELAMDLFRTIQAITRRVARELGKIQRALQKIQTGIDSAVSGLVKGFADLLTFVIEWVLGPLRTHLDNLSRLWDEWIGRHIPDVLGEDSLRHPLGYMWNDVWYEWGTGPLGEEPHAGQQRVRVHPATDAQLLAAVAEYSRANGGIARALWGPVG